MKIFIENKYPYALVMIIGIILSSALALEYESHNKENQENRESYNKC